MNDLYKSALHALIKNIKVIVIVTVLAGALAVTKELVFPPNYSADTILLVTGIERGGSATTIARVTCPTAPKFWRWRDIPFPKIAPREMEIHDDDHHINEWKWQLVLAIACGVFGLLAAFVSTRAGRLSAKYRQVF